MGAQKGHFERQEKPMNLRHWVRVWWRIGTDVGGPWMGLRNVVAGLRQRMKPRGITVYRAATNSSPPLVGLNRYPSGVIGVGFRLPGHRVMSVVWRRAR